MLAKNRLNMCYLRDDDSDSLIGAIVGLEALLTVKNQKGIKQNLIKRMIELNSLLPSSTRTAQTIKTDIGRLYKYRSELVHSSSPSPDNPSMNQARISSGIERALAIEYLRLALQLILENPKCVSPNEIDLITYGSSSPSSAS